MRIVRISALAICAELALISSALAETFETLPDDGVRHTSSGFVFPKHVGPFQRARMHQFDQGGLDVEAAYYANGITASIYVYPAPADARPSVLQSEYASKRAEVLQVNHGVTVLLESKTSVEQSGKKRWGWRASFSFRDVFARKPRDLKSQLLVFQQGSNFIEYRFTYPKDEAEEADKHVDRFIRIWSWPKPSKSNQATPPIAPGSDA